MNTTVYYDFAQLFDADEYLYFMEDTLRLENTPAQVDFIEQRVAAFPGTCMRLVDLGCGHGRHAVELARRGHAVTAIDLAEGFLAVGRRAAADAGVEVRFLHGDMAAMEFEAQFDGAICLFDAFGFFDDSHALRTLQAVHRALLPGGRLLLDLRTREWMLRLPPASVVDKGNGDLMIDRQQFDALSGRLVDRRTTLRGERRRDVQFSVRLYTFTEIHSLLLGAGFEIEWCGGGFDGAPLSIDLDPRDAAIGRERRP
jgi:SAM-dependent methyltransferase